MRPPQFTIFEAISQTIHNLVLKIMRNGFRYGREVRKKFKVYDSRFREIKRRMMSHVSIRITKVPEEVKKKLNEYR